MNPANDEIYSWSKSDDEKLRSFIFQECVAHVEQTKPDEFVKFMNSCYNWIKAAKGSTH